MVTLGKLCRTFFWIGLTSYGGPAIVAQIRRVTVLKKRWLTEGEFEESLAFCQTLPGPIAVQTAAHIGWRLHGGMGAFLVLLFYDLPAFLLMLGLSWAYFRFGQVPVVRGIFVGLGAVVVGIVADSILSMARPALKDWRGVVLAAGAAAGFFTRQPTLLVLFGAALAGMGLTWSLQPRVEGGNPAGEREEAPAGRRKTLAWVLLLAVFFSALVMATGFLGKDLPALGAAMIKVNLLAFGGGYTAIALMYEQVVASKAWLTPKEFVDGLALGQVTPGPVIMTSTFIGYRVGGPLASVLSTFCVFWPSALLLVMLAPEFDRLRRIRAVGAAVRGLLAAFVAMLFFVLWQVTSASVTDLPTLLMSLAGLALLRLKVAPGWVILGALVLSVVLFRA